ADGAKKELVVGLIQEVDRINEIIEGLLSFSKPSKPETELIGLDALLEQTLTLVATTAKKRKIAIDYKFNALEKLLKADPAQLKQVFLNIMMNALQAMDDGGKLQIAVESSHKDGLFASELPAKFLITFQDTGEGIQKENLDHVFDPFFTTKKDGTGLGLSISYGIIQQHGGEIEIESVSKKENSEAHGTKVTIVLPIYK
ncbi:ATP-binding protein, partial [candidate division KSB1 bacterium]|nr:ATP-binding protein [candidate division KSB1 bacterium]